MEATAFVFPRRLLLMLAVPTLLMVVGSLGYHFIEGRPYFDSLYFTVITLTTVGYGDIVPETRAGRVFTIFLALGGIFALFYVAGEMIRLVVSGEVQTVLGRRRMEQNLSEMTGHLIVCGFGRMGRLVCKEFAAQRLPFVVIDRDEKLLEGFPFENAVPMHGDATSDEVLRHAGIDRARALVTVLASDADNLYITMSARLLNDKLFIVARAEGEPAEKKLQRAGASRVVSPYTIGGSRMAQAVLRPAVVDFIELATRTEHLDLQIEETLIAAGSRLANRSLEESRVRREMGVIIVAIKKAAGHMVFNPPGDAVMAPGDLLITLGNRNQLDQLDQMAKASG
jgi:voltage-gated potassium channel